jgi:hypothetical protein
VPVPLPIEPRQRLLPLTDLPWPEFETFCQAYVSARPEVRRVEAYAKHGEPQDGIDLIAFLDGGLTRTYQCRKRAVFSKAEAVDVVRATTRVADEHEILIACEAGRGVRDYVHSLRPDWVLSDCKDLSLAVRELDREKARNVVEDAFGVPCRRAFLGPQESLVFVAPERFFGPFERPGALFRHTWELVGRDEALAALIAAVTAPRVRVVILVGRGGIGKTRLLRALAESLDQRRVLFALDDAEISREAVDTMPLSEAVVVVDDVHRRDGGVAALIDAVVRRDADPLTLVLATRPQSVDELRGSLALAGLAPDEVAILPPLDDLDPWAVEALARQALGGENASWIDPLVTATADCPLVTVIGGQLLAQRKVQPALFEREEDFRFIVLERWRAEMLGRISDDVDAHAAATTLRLVAALAPVNIEDIQTLELMADEAGLSVPEMARMLSELLEAGLLIAHGRLRRIVPDALADHLLHRACLDRQDMPTTYAEDLFDRYGPTSLATLLRNLGELDWRIGATSGASQLLNAVWGRIESGFLSSDSGGRVMLIDQLRPTAHLQPERVLALVRLALQRPAAPSPLEAVLDVDVGAHVREKLIELVRRAGTSDEHVEAALEILWPLGRDGPRRPGATVTDPAHVMRHLGDYHGNGHAAGVLVAFVERLLVGPDADAPVSPLALLEHLGAREGINLVQAGLGFEPVPYSLRSTAVDDLRRHVFALLAYQARYGTARNALIAVDLLGGALTQPRGAFGRPIPPEVFDQWLPEQLELLSLIAELMTGTAPLLRSRLRTAATWHANHSAWPRAKAAAQRILDVPEREDEQLMTAAACPFDFHRSQSDDAGRIHAVVEILADAPAAASTRLEALLTDLEGARADPNPRQLLTALTARAPSCGATLIDAALKNPEGPLSPYLDTLLSAVGRFAPERLAGVLAASEDAPLSVRRGIAGYFQGLEWNEGPCKEEGALLARLLEDDDAVVRHSAMRALLQLRHADVDRAIQLALSADVGTDSDLAALMCLTLSQPSASLDNGQLERALSKLRDVDELKHPVVEFIAKVGEHDPSSVIAFFLDRLHRSRGRRGYEPVPWHPFDHDVLAGADEDMYLELLRRVREESLSTDGLVRSRVPRLFWHLNRDTDLSLLVLHEWLICDETPKVKAAGKMLSEIAPSCRSRVRDEEAGWAELLGRPWFIVDVLQHAVTRPVEAATAARTSFAEVLLTQDVTRTMGQADERQLRSRDAAESLVTLLPREAVARTFFAELAKHATQMLAKERMDDEEFPHRVL